VHGFASPGSWLDAGNLPFGTCRVVVSRTWVTQTIFGAIQEIGGFEREAWLE